MISKGDLAQYHSTDMLLVNIESDILRDSFEYPEPQKMIKFIHDYRFEMKNNLNSKFRGKLLKLDRSDYIFKILDFYVAVHGLIKINIENTSSSNNVGIGVSLNGVYFCAE